VALDYGRRRIGVAVSDPTATIASPHSAVDRRGDPDALPDALLDLLERLEPATVVVGVPRHMDGSEGEMVVEVRAFADSLREATGLPVEEWDERLTTAAAERALVEGGAPRNKRRERGRIDAMAATMLLRSYLASRR
jgi:putative Holliday junction resolvase